MPQADSRSTTPWRGILPRATRKIVDDAIKQHMRATDALIAFLDLADPADGDEEPCVTDGPHDGDTDREPSLAHTNDLNQVQAQRHLRMANHQDGLWRYKDADLEAEHDGREPDEDAEPEPGELDTVDDEPRCPPMMDGAP